MVTMLEFNCPYCRRRFDVFLSLNATSIILHCPDCFKPILFHEKRCVRLTQNQINGLQHDTLPPGLLETLHNFIDKSPDADNTVVEQTVSVPPVRRSRIISRDDVLNIRIELQRCRDCLEFITRI